MKLKRHNWFDTETKTLKYGIQVRFSGKWCNVLDSNGPCIYDTEQECDAEIERMRGGFRNEGFN